MTSWTDYQDDISDAISDSMDMDWSANDGARAVVAWLNENKPLMADTPRVTVPVEPTEAMLDAWHKAVEAGIFSQTPHPDYMREAYRAMLSAAPAPEGGAVKRACVVFQEAIDDFEAEVADVMAEGSERADLWDREIMVNIDALKTVMIAALATREEAPAEAGADDVQRTASGETVLGFKVAAWQYLGPNDDSDAKYGHRYCEHWSTVGSHPKKVVRLFTEDQLRAAIRAQPQAREGEAVAWRCSRDHASDGNGQWFYHDGPPRPSPLARNVQPLFLHPAPDALRAIEILQAEQGAK